MSKKQVVITEEQWEETVDNWVNHVIGKPANYRCGFCVAVNIAQRYCRDCPANEICDRDVYRWSDLIEGRKNEKALEVLEWLYDFGKIAGWY